MNTGCDIEIMEAGHCVALTGLVELGGGKYSLDVTHDSDQYDGESKDSLVTETVTYDDNTLRFSGGSLNGDGFAYAVIECPNAP